MTTLETKAGTAQAIDTTTQQAGTLATAADAAALITEQQVLFASAAALAPAPAKHRHIADLASTVHAWFARPEKPHAQKHYPQRFGYLENSAMSRAMDRL